MDDKDDSKTKKEDEKVSTTLLHFTSTRSYSCAQNTMIITFSQETSSQETNVCPSPGYCSQTIDTTHHFAKKIW